MSETDVIGRPDVIPPEVLPGCDGWLFFAGDQAIFRRLYSNAPLTLWQLFLWRWLILRRVRRARALGARYLQLIVPDKMSVWREKLEGAFPPSAMSPARRLGASLPARVRRENWIDAYSAFREARAGANLYFRTDTHWCMSGFLLGYRLICAACGTEPAAHLLAATIHEHPGVMDIASKCEPPVVEMAEGLVFEARARRLSCNDLVTFREAHPEHVVGTSFGSRIVLRNDDPYVDPRTIVVFGDSHLYHHTGLGPMLGETFREVHMLWSSPIDWGYVARVRPDILIHQLSERFLRRLPKDGLDLEAFANERLEAARRAETPSSVPVAP